MSYSLQIPVTTPTLGYHRSILNGFSLGILILAVCALIWLSGAIYCAVCARVGLDPLGDANRVDIPAVWLMLNLTLAGALIAGSVKVRRLSRRVAPICASQANESSQANAPLTEYRRRLTRRFLQIAVAEWIGVVAAVRLGIVFHRPDLIWPPVPTAMRNSNCCLAKSAGS
ncbi:MAG TPA: hypothetical protein VIY49_08340 [Bryobacteraceae bacterium]